MIDLLLEIAGHPDLEPQFLEKLDEHVAAVKASAGKGDRRQVVLMEAEVQANPEASFEFDAAGYGTLRTGGADIPAGRFETPSIGTLRNRVAVLKNGDVPARARLWVLVGDSPASDIGSLQATNGPGTLFQVASQFNCLESPGPYVSRVSNYFTDPTQGPRASISAFPGTLLRHYAAPHADVRRFVQRSDGPQINLLEAICTPEIAEVRSGYLAASGIANALALAEALESRFEEIRVGVHDDVPVLLGYNWDGAVEGQPRIGQVFTSTYAGGSYSGRVTTGPNDHRICSALLRAAYFGTLLAAAASRRPKVVLTLIGGGAFANPMSLIWNSICWAIDETEPMLSTDMDVVVNGRNLGNHLGMSELLPTVRARNGVIVAFNPSGVSVYR